MKTPVKNDALGSAKTSPIAKAAKPNDWSVWGAGKKAAWTKAQKKAAALRSQSAMPARQRGDSGETARPADALSLSGFKDSHLNKVLNSARSRARKSGLECSLTTEDVIQLWTKCNGCCAVSGRHFSVESRGGGLVKHPFAPSLDKVNWKRGYTVDNTRLVCVAVNFGMNQWGEETYYELAECAIRMGKTRELRRSLESWQGVQEANIQQAQRLMQTMSGAEKATQLHRIAGLKRAMTLGPEGLLRAAAAAIATRRRKLPTGSGETPNARS